MKAYSNEIQAVPFTQNTVNKVTKLNDNNKNDKKDDNIDLSNNNNGNNAIQSKKNSNIIITVKKEKMFTINNIVKSSCFHTIPYIHSSREGLFLHILVATITTFPGANLIYSN